MKKIQKNNSPLMIMTSTFSNIKKEVKLAVRQSVVSYAAVAVVKI
jgi:hypothetical protein